MTDLTAPHFTDADKARQHLEKTRWGGEPVCPHCGVIGGHYALEGKAHRPGLWKCKDCRQQFSVTVGTVFESSKIPLNKWLLAIHLMCASKKGISAHQLHRMLGITYKSAWFMAHRIREAMNTTPTGKLGGGGKHVEVDETYWGNNPKRGAPKRAYHDKMKIVTLVERHGEKRSFHVPKVNGETLRPILTKHIAEQAKLNTDEAQFYKPLGKMFASHDSVNHARDEFYRGDVSTCSVESSFSLLKRGLVGTFHHVSEEHLQRYLTEFDFRWNHRKTDDDTRANALAAQIGGKRLTYRQPSSV